MALSMVNTSPLDIEKCVNNSFVEPGNFESDNKYLREDRKWQALMEIHTHPAVSINNHTYHGDLDGQDVARALCASFQTRPEVCSQETF